MAAFPFIPCFFCFLRLLFLLSVQDVLKEINHLSASQQDCLHENRQENKLPSCVEWKKSKLRQEGRFMSDVWGTHVSRLQMHSVLTLEYGSLAQNPPAFMKGCHTAAPRR